MSEKEKTELSSGDGELTAKKVIVHATIKSPLLFTAAASTYQNLSKSFGNIGKLVSSVSTKKLPSKKDEENAALDEENAALEALQENILSLTDSQRFDAIASFNGLTENDLCQREILYRKRALIYLVFFVLLLAVFLGYAVTNIVGVFFSLPLLLLSYALCLREAHRVEIFKKRSLIKFKPFMQGFMGYELLLTTIEPIPDFDDIQLRKRG